MFETISDEALNVDLAWFALNDEEKQAWLEANPLVGPRLPEVFAPIRIGRRFRRALGTRMRADGTFVETPVSKKDRRVARKLGLRGTVERKLDSSRAERLEVARLATNSHERKRYKALLAKTKRAERDAKTMLLKAAASHPSSSPTSTPSDSSVPSPSTSSES